MTTHQSSPLQPSPQQPTHLSPSTLPHPPTSTPLPQVLVTFDPEVTSIPDGQGYSVVHAAVEAEDLDVLRFVLSLKPDVNMQTMNESEYASGNWILDGDPIMPVDKTPLHLAVEQGDVQAAQLLLEAGGWLRPGLQMWLHMHAGQDALARRGSRPLLVHACTLTQGCDWLISQQACACC